MKPEFFQIRNSNRFVIAAALTETGIIPNQFHVTDNHNLIREKIESGISDADAVIVCGGVSKGKFDFVHKVLADSGAEKLFHTVLQKPGKPFWFGTLKDKPVFAFPGNPVSVYLCFHRYFIPWLKKSMHEQITVNYAKLSVDISFSPKLSYFLPVSVRNSHAQVIAEPIGINNSGDFSNLMRADAFMELPAERTDFRAGDIYPVWPFKNIF
jgi:molybdopterin molybdotransferase